MAKKKEERTPLRAKDVLLKVCRRIEQLASELALKDEKLLGEYADAMSFAFQLEKALEKLSFDGFGDEDIKEEVEYQLDM